MHIAYINIIIYGIIILFSATLIVNVLYIMPGQLLWLSPYDGIFYKFLQNYTTSVLYSKFEREIEYW